MVSLILATTLINPDNITFTGPPGNHPAELYGTYTNYPSNPVCGNDDKTTGDPEDNNPYDAPVGKLNGVDSPSRSPVTDEGAVGNTFEIRLQFKEFSRVEFQGNWYRISDDFLWRIQFKFKKASEAADNQDYNGDGDKTDILWINNGTDKALDNNGF